MKGGTYMTQLYAWRRPAVFQNDVLIDHTYVTDYSPFNKYLTIDDVIKAGAHFWYCWGDFNMKTKDQSLVPECPASGLSADLKVVCCICEANDKNAHGTIFEYGVDGVCQQLANQVLYPTNPRITVEGVKGWQLTYLFYTAYGRNVNDWIELVNKCMPGVRKMSKGKKYIDKVGSLIEKLPKKKRDFVNKVIEETDKERRKFYDEMEKGKITPVEFAERVNKLHDSQLLRIADEIGRDDYIRLFGAPPEKPVHLVDPEVARVFFKK
jgi:hypothetical protein